MTTKIINLIAAPGSGKSTIASELFAKMKWQGKDVELVSEFAKDLVWEDRKETFKNGLYIFAKQYHRMFRLLGKVEYIITDCPLILSAFYNNKYGDRSEAFNTLVMEKFNSFENRNFYLHRTKPYIEKGRNQKEEEVIQIAVEIEVLLSDYGIDYCPLLAVENSTSEVILNLI